MPLDSIALHFPAIIKAVSKDGKRLVEVEASSEAVDGEGDVILQSALLDSAASFIKNGHLDIDHLSEIGSRLGIANPMAFIVGRPTEVIDLGKGRTAVRGEIMKSADGSVDPDKNKYDAFWDSLQSEPPVMWRASIFGFPKEGGVEDCSKSKCDLGATRWLVKAIDWRSLAFTRNPVNTDLKGTAKIVSSKALVEFIMKSDTLRSNNPALGDVMKNAFPSSPAAGAVINAEPFTVGDSYEMCPMNLNEMIGQYHLHMKTGKCPYVSTEGNSVAAFKTHYELCCCASPHQADILARSMMYEVIRDKDR